MVQVGSRINNKNVIDTIINYSLRASRLRVSKQKNNHS